MRIPTMQFWIHALVALVTTFPPSIAWAQLDAQEEVTVRASLSRESVFVGDELSFVVEIYGAADPQITSLDLPQGLGLVSHGRSFQSTNSTIIENGQRKQVRQRRFIFQFTITANKDGSFTIPAPVVEDRGIRYTGNETGFRSVLPSESLDDELVINIDRTRLYQNETIELECVWWLGDNTSQFNFGSSSIPESFEIRPVGIPGNSPYKIDFPLDGQIVSGQVSTGIHNGREKSSFTFRMSITPTELGSFELGPFRTLFTRQPSVGDRYRAYIESNTIEIEVVPVPEQGKPSIYDGAMGEFVLESRASANDVYVGDPIELTLRVQGDEPMTGLRDAPDLNTHPGFAGNFKIDSEGWRELTPRRDGTRIFQTTIRALNDSIREIPAIQVASFDPAIGQYRIFKSDPIPLRVDDVKEVTLADAIVTGDRPLTPPERRLPIVERVELTPAAPGLWAHGTLDDMTRREGFDLIETLQQPAWIATIITPPSLYFSAMLVLAYRRNRNQERVRLKGAYRNARRMSGTESLRAYASEVLRINQDALVAADASLLGVNRELEHEVQRTLLQAERPGGVVKDSAQSDLLQRVHTALIAKTHEGSRS